MNIYIQDPHFIWPISLLTTQTVSHDGRQRRSRRYLNLPCVGIHVIQVTVLQLMLGFYWPYLNKALWSFRLMHCSHSLTVLKRRCRQWFPSARINVPHTTDTFIACLHYAVWTANTTVWVVSFRSSSGCGFLLRTLSFIVPQFVNEHGIFYPKPVILRVHISMEMKPNFGVKQSECPIHFSIMHSLKVPVRNIQSCFAICVTELDTSVSCATRNNNLAPISSGRLLWRVSCMFASCSEWNLLLESSSRIWKLTSRFEQTHQSFFVCVYIDPACTIGI